MLVLALIIGVLGPLFAETHQKVLKSVELSVLAVFHEIGPFDEFGLRLILLVPDSIILVGAGPILMARS